MARHELTDEEIETFRERAVSVAETLFAEKGLAGVTMRAVASELGCSPMTAYRYFADHESLISELRAVCFTRLSDELAASVAGLRAPEKRIAAVRQSYVEHALQNPDGYRLMFSLEPPSQPHERLRVESQRSFAPLLQAVEESIHQGKREGDALTVAHLIWAELHGLVSLQLSKKLNFGRSLKQLLACTSTGAGLKK